MKNNIGSENKFHQERNHHEKTVNVIYLMILNDLEKYKVHFNWNSRVLKSIKLQEHHINRMRKFEIEYCCLVLAEIKYKLKIIWKNTILISVIETNDLTNNQNILNL